MKHVLLKPCQQRPPKRYKTVLLTLIWVGVFPTITILLYILSPLLAAWPLVLRTLVLSTIMVPLLTYIVMPPLNRLAQPWLCPKHRYPNGW
ncbi:MAG: hypothetical protein F6K42_06795 [Leptolyngbya sp. SIO1D8]|nr:hypothetical protein [Leptolyngbya sp. SIO1D8]